MNVSRTIASGAALVGAADTAVFLAKRPQLFAEAPGRAGGSVAMLALWVGAATAAARGRRRAAITLSGVNAAGQAAMLAVHVRHGVASPRVYMGAALGAAALATAVAS